MMIHSWPWRTHDEAGALNYGQNAFCVSSKSPQELSDWINQIRLAHTAISFVKVLNCENIPDLIKIELHKLAPKTKVGRYHHRYQLLTAFHFS